MKNEGDSEYQPSPKAILRAANDEYNRRLKEIMSEANKDYRPLELGHPSECLQRCGVPNLPIQMSVQRLVDKKLQSNHPFSLLSVVHMPLYIADPIAVFISKTDRIDRKVILTEMQEKNVNIVVVIELNRPGVQSNANSVRSVYPKDNIKDVLQWIANYGLVEYYNKEKILEWLGKQQSNSADVTRLLEDCTNVVQNNKAA